MNRNSSIARAGGKRIVLFLAVVITGGSSLAWAVGLPETPRSKRRAVNETFLSGPVVRDTVDGIFLNGDYLGVVGEVDKRLVSPRPADDREELLYLKALALLKERRTKEARTVFEGILGTYPNGRRAMDARIGIGDAAYVAGDYAGAERIYGGLLKSGAPDTNAGIIYYRLGLVYNASGRRTQAAEAFEKVKALAPQSFEARMIPLLVKGETENACGIPSGGYSVQVGAFKAEANALHLVERLKARGYADAFIEAAESRKGGRYYKVRAGRSTSLVDVGRTEKRLKADGYSTKICE